MRRKILFLWVALILTACSGGKGTLTPTPNAADIMTAVKLTVDANSTEMVALTPSATLPPTATETSLPETPTLALSPTETLTPTLAASFTSAVADSATLVSQSVADNTVVNPGQTFQVTWTFKNTGATTWTTDYAAKFWSDNLMGAAQSLNFSKSVNPEDTLALTMTLSAPTKIGTAKSSWWLQNPQGVNFYPFYVIVVVAAPPTGTATSVPTVTPTVANTNTPTVIPTTVPTS